MNEMDDIDMWNAAAASYEAAVDAADWHQQHVISPAMFGLLGQVADQDILDAGCGPGWLSVALARRGARVVGIDAAEQMILRAHQRAKDASQSIRFTQADLCSPLPLENRSFDGIVCNMVLMDIPTIDMALAEFRRLLRLHGRLVFSITHPSFHMWLWTRDASGNKLYKPVDDYLTIRSDMNNFWGPTRHYHRPLSWYFEALVSAGFVVDALLEPTLDFERNTETDHDWRIPDFMVIRALPRPRRL